MDMSISGIERAASAAVDSIGDCMVGLFDIQRNAAGARAIIGMVREASESRPDTDTERVLGVIQHELERIDGRLDAILDKLEEAGDRLSDIVA